MISLSIIIPVKNEAHNLAACLNSIQEACSAQLCYEILVIDNGSDDSTVSVAEQFGTTVYVVPGTTVAGLRNVGAEKASGDVLAFIDADCTVESDWFYSLLPYIADDSVAAFGSPPGIPETSTWVQKCWYQVRKKGSIDRFKIPVEWLESMNFFIRRDVFLAAKGFDVSLVTCEDYDLCMRLKSFGDIICDTRIRAIHHGEAKTIKRFYTKERWRGVSNLKGFRQHNFPLAELPSLLFPFMQLLAISMITLALTASLVGYIPVWWSLLLTLLWQAPLLLMAFAKSQVDRRLMHTCGIWTLLNVYMTARGQALFLGAAWR